MTEEIRWSAQQVLASLRLDQSGDRYEITGADLGDGQLLLYAKRNGIDVTIPVPVSAVLLGVNMMGRTLAAARFESNELVCTFTSDQQTEAS